jgi:predicted Zn-dependent protease with MMP-like domain
MLLLTDGDFSKLIATCMDELPEQYVTGMKNVLVTYEDAPTEEQRRKQKLQPYQTLFGLYEGVPLTKRNAGYQFVLPDRITIFKLPILQASNNLEELKARVKHTLWHEIAHYYGLDHDRIHEIERNWQS